MKDKSNVLEEFAKWLGDERFPWFTTQFFDERADCPTASRLTPILEVDLTEDDITYIFWLSKEGWSVELDEVSDTEADDLIRKMTHVRNTRRLLDAKGDYIEYTTDEKAAWGQIFREGSNGLRIFDWMAPIVESG